MLGRHPEVSAPLVLQLSLTWPGALTDSMEPEQTIWVSGNGAAVFCFLTRALHLQPQLRWESLGLLSSKSSSLSFVGFSVPSRYSPDADSCTLSLLMMGS